MKNDNFQLEVYFNRIRKDWSVRRRRIVIEHAPDVVLIDCSLIASERARQRFLRTGVRDVHALIRGNLADGPRPPEAVPIGYNPKEKGFRRRDTGAVVNHADAVWFERDGSAWALAPTASPETRA